MIYRHNNKNLAAAVAIERRGSYVMLDFLARGRSQKRAGGKVVGYATRNPDRRQVVDDVLFELAVAFPKAPVVGTAGGKGAPFELLDPPLLMAAGRGVPNPAVRSSYSAAGNYRWRVWLRLPQRLSALDVALLVGLVPDEHHRAVTTEWPEALA
jgi:hypothetical protein